MLFKQKMMKQTQFSKNNKGVTLIEVIAVVAVLGVVMAAVTGFMITGTKMSARVSDTAASSMKDETAVEFINRRILNYGKQSLAVNEEVTNDKGEVIGYSDLLITLSEQDNSYAMLTTEDGVVVYKMGTKELLVNTENSGADFDKDVRSIEICPGDIYFNLENNTVTYVLNDVEHVVHLRVAEQP